MPEICFEAAEVRVESPDLGDERTILHPTTLTLTEQRIGIIGSNGSGKSTLARMINGLVTATPGASPSTASTWPAKAPPYAGASGSPSPIRPPSW